MGTMERIEASRDVDRLEHDAASAWRSGGCVPGELGNVTLETLREALTDALADVEPMRSMIAKINENAIEAALDLREKITASVLLEEDQSELREVHSSFTRCLGAHPQDLASELVELLSDVIAYYRDKEPAVARGETAATISAPVALPPRTHKARTGSTTMALPFLFDHKDGVNVRVTDPMPSPLAPVKRKPGRPKGNGGEKKKAA